MEDIFDIAKFDSYREDNRREVKKQKVVCQIHCGKRTLLLQIVMEELLFLEFRKTRIVRGVPQAWMLKTGENC